MDRAIRYVELYKSFVVELLGAGNQSVITHICRKFDRVVVNGKTKYFVDKNTWDIFGAKSESQFNPRRWYCTLETVDQFNWAGEPTPKEGSDAYLLLAQREAKIKAGYKKRGRPKKNAVAVEAAV
jgi:hypothetical protein